MRNRGTNLLGVWMSDCAREPLAGRWRHAALACVAAAAASAVALADGTVGQVYVYNGGATNQGTQGDIFTAGAQGWIFQNMGLLGPEGQYPTINGNNVESPAGTVRGTVIRDANNNIIGFQSSDGKQRAYNVDTSATVRDAWNAVGMNGTLTIAKHGANGGGGITLDGGRMYDGFRPQGGAGGTGQGNPAGPYDLPPRPGANITLYANGCYTSADPPGPSGSVTGSAAGVPGVGGTQGNDGVIYKGPEIEWSGTNAQIDAALARLEVCARRSGLRDEDGNPLDGLGWVARLPMPQQYQAVRDCVAGTGAGFSLSYGKSDTCGAGTDEGGVSCYYLPVTNIDIGGGTLVYHIGPGHLPVFLQIPPGSLPFPTPVFLTTTVGDDVQFPPNTLPATDLVEVRAYGEHPPLQFVVPALLHVRFPIEDEFVGFFKVLSNGTLAPHPAVVDPALGLIQTQIQQGGVYVGLRAVPPLCPADWCADGDVGVSDIFCFLTDWFNGVPEAINFGGNPGVPAIFAFLTIWFAAPVGPCP